MMLLASIGFENCAQPDSPVGHVIVSPVKLVVRFEEFSVLETPAGCGHDALVGPVGPAWTQDPAGALEFGVPMLYVSTPDVAKVSLWAMVLLTILTFKESCNEIPAPSQP